MRIVSTVILLLTVQLVARHASATDWPTWRHDAGRSGATDEQLPTELHLQWTRKLPPLKPAWPEDVRLQFDAQYEPIVKGKLMFIASSRNDSVTAYDTDSGEMRWRFFADGPVRFAPIATNDELYFGADDGCLYCLEAATGKFNWKLNATPANRRAIGNERLISVWPMRGGPVLVKDVIYFTVGVWPFEGTRLLKVDLKSAKGDSIPKFTVTPLDNLSPQGYLASNGSILVIPCGRANAHCRDISKGTPVSLRYGAKGKTDYHVIAHEDWMFHGPRVIHLGIRRLVKIAVVRPIVSDGKLFFVNKGKALSKDIKNQEEVDTKDRKGKIVKVKTPKLLWQSDVPVTKVHLKTSKRVFAHHNNSILAIEIPVADEKPKVSFTAKIDGTCSTMLAADGKLFVTTKQGNIYCFGPDKVTPKKLEEEKGQLATDRAWAKIAASILNQTKVINGYCLALGIGTGHLIEELVRQSQLTIIAIDPDAKNVEQFRRRLDSTGVNGTRVMVLKGSPADINLPPYFASLMVSEDVAANIGSKNIRRTFQALRPYGGVACFTMNSGQHDAFAKEVKESDLPNAVVGRDNQWTTLTRESALPGSADWTHEYGDPSNTLLSRDTLVKAPLGTLWFGGPSSDGKLYYDRHHWAPSLTVIEGRMFFQGKGILTAVDVYTGRILWQNKLPGGISLGRRGLWSPSGYHFVAGKDALYMAYPTKVLMLDPKTGKQTGEFGLADKEDRWGSIRVVKNFIIAPIFRSVKDRGNLPIKLVCIDRKTGEAVWSSNAEQSFAMVAIGNDKVFCVDAVLEGLRQGFNEKRLRGNPRAATDVIIKAIDAKSGLVIWKRPMRRAPSWLAYSEHYNVVVTSNKNGIDAMDGINGKELWSKKAVGVGFRGHPENYYGRVILKNNWVIDQRGPGAAYDIMTGKSIKRAHPITGKEVNWKFTKSGHHCNYAIASEHLLTFRAKDAGFCDLASGGTARLVGFRSGCRNSLIPANGVLNAPNFAFGCICSYSIFTSLALVHVPDTDMWTYSAQKAGDGPVQRLGINIGALGDRQADDGTLWLDYPNVGGSSPSVPVKIVTDAPKWFRLPSTQLSGDGLKWVAACGVTGIKTVKIPTVVGKAKATEKSYTVRLYFTEPDNSEPGQRIFDVRIQGRMAIQNLDVAKEAGGSQRVLVKEVRGIKTNLELTISFASRIGRALISGVEIVAEVN